MRTKFDYVVIGAGSAGAVMASRLSENPTVNVCLLEAGGKDTNPCIHVPFGLALLSRFKSLNWGYHTTAQKALNNRSLFWPRGKTLGGSSSLNAMCYIRGQKQDYDRWQAMGAEGWSFEDVLPWFKKSEDFYGKEDEFHGVDGPLRVEALKHNDPLSQCFVNASSYVGLPNRADFNRDDREGLGFYDVTQKDGRRWSTAQAYLNPALNRPNLTVITHAVVEKILLNNGRAEGVEARIKDKQCRILASREVLLCGGAINSPHLLMLSGIGPKDSLQDKEVTVRKVLPGVGANLQDHLDAIVQYQSVKPAGYGVAVSAIPKYVSASAKYVFGRNGLLSSNIAEAGGFASSSLAAKGEPDIQFHFLPAILADHGRQLVYGYGFGVHVCCLYPKSRGAVQLQSKDPTVKPLIAPNYLSHEDDLRVLVDGVKLAQKIVGSASFDGYRGKQVAPATETDSDDAIEDFIREEAQSIYHPVGTCKMGRCDDPMAVVDNRCKVIGIDGLRVVDASVMPSLIGGNTNAPTIMIAERVADFIASE